MAHHGNVNTVGNGLGSGIRTTHRLSEEATITWSERRFSDTSRAAASAASFQSVIFAATFLLVLLCLSPLTLPAQRPFHPDTAHLQRLLVAEDARGSGMDGIAPLLEGLRSSDTMLRRVAVRGVGRLQRPELAPQLEALLADQVPAVRGEAGNAIAQAVSRVPRNVLAPGQSSVRAAAAALDNALQVERDSVVSDALAEALGRLPFGDVQPVQDSGTARAAQAAILAHGGSGLGAVHGLYVLSTNRGTTGGLTAAGLAFIQRAARSSPDPRIRRVALLTLTPTPFVDSITIVAASRDPDEQVRRLALAGVRALSPAARTAFEQAALGDQSPMVRIAAIAAVRAGVQRPDCNPIMMLIGDEDPYVALAAIDAIAAPCGNSDVAGETLVRMLDRPPFPGGSWSWQMQAHALVSLTRIDPSRASGAVTSFGASTDAHRRAWAAKAAAMVRDTNLLLHLTRDRDNNVREAAIAGLAALVRHAADSAFVAGLSSPGYQVVLASANALAGSQYPSALPALFDAFDRLSTERRENAKDPRVAVLKRIAEMGSSANAERLRPYLADFDTTIATNVAATLSKWTGIERSATEVAARPEAAARPVPLRIQAEPLARVFLAKDVQLKVTMAAASGGGTFTIRLFTDEAPATAARIIRLAREHYYDGHVFQRVEPNFVVQGGGPDASEYVGDGPFMRDEVTWRAQLRGTVGISTRGRDTGDAQWFFNLVDNTRLDHDYTVFGELISGRNVVERILEGDAIGRVEVVGGP